jgi:STE24 endopeptidase
MLDTTLGHGYADDYAVSWPMAIAPPAQEVDSSDARQYNRIRRRLSVLDAVLGLAVLGALLVTGWTMDLRDLTHRGDHSYGVALALYVILLSVIAKVVGLGLDYYSFRLEHQFHLSNQKFGSWLWDQFKGWLVGLVISILLAEIIYGLIRWQPQTWWITAWAVFVVLFIVFAQIAPVVLFPVFYKFRPLENEELKQRLVSLGERAGTRVRGVYEWKLSEKSKKANAALTGLGNTRRIILADTLLTNYSTDEIESVLAHELGHHVHKHILKSIIVQAVVTFIGFWAVKSMIRIAVQREWFSGQYDFANLPLLVLVTSVVSMLLMPALNAWSRHNERQADRYAWESTGQVAPFISSMNKLADQNLAERNPSRWVELLFHSHPAVSKRVAAAEAWAEKNQLSART